ncbi:hypothetical protein Tco_0983040 [Tanacetum coccineum]
MFKKKLEDPKEVSQHSESRTSNLRGEHRRRQGSRRPCSTSSPEPTLSVFSKIRREGSKSPRHRDFEREAVFTRLGRKEKGIFNRLRGKGRSVSARSSDSKTQRHRNAQREAESRYQSSYSRKAELIPRKRYHEGTSSRRTEAVTQSFSLDPEISFPPLGDEDGTEGPMIIEAVIGGHFIHLIYIDGELTSEILYEYCFSRLCLEVKSQMVPATAPLIGFSKEIIWPIGQISLSVKIGDTKHSISTRMNFVVVRSPSPYNGIIGMPEVRKIQAFPSTAHEMLKFLVPGGILTLRSSKLIPLECTMVSGPEVQPSVSTRVMEEIIKVVIHPEYP